MSQGTLEHIKPEDNEQNHKHYEAPSVDIGPRGIGNEDSNRA